MLSQGTQDPCNHTEHQSLTTIATGQACLTLPICALEFRHLLPSAELQLANSKNLKDVK